MTDFYKELERQVQLEEDSHTKALEQGMLKRTPLDSLREKGVFNAGKLVGLFSSVLDKKLIGFSAVERQYIHSLGMVAFARVMVKLQKEAETNDVEKK